MAVLAGWSALPMFAQDNEVSLSLEAAVSMALQNSHTIKIADLELQRALLQRREGQSALYPQVEAYSTFGYNYAIPKMVIPGEVFGQSGSIPVEFGTKYDWNSGIKVSLLLYNQSYYTSLRVLTELVDVQRLSVEQKQEELVFQVSQLYYLCLMMQQQQRVLDSTVANIKRIENITTSMANKGIARNADALRVAKDRIKVQADAELLGVQLAQQENLLKFLMGLNLQAKLVLTDSLNQVGSLATKSEVLVPSTTIEFRLMAKQLQIAELQQESAKQEYLPSVAFYAQHYYQGMRDEFDFFDGEKDRFSKAGVVGLNISVPIFNGFAKRSKLQQQQVQVKQLRFQQEQLNELLNKNISDAELNYSNSLVALAHYSAVLDMAREVYGVTLSGYNQQAVSLTDLLIADNELTQSELSYNNALYQVKTAQLNLLKAQGQLLNR